MESPISEDMLNARRKAVVLNGLPLLGLAFQTLGMCAPIPIVPASGDHVVSHIVQALSTPILALSALSSFHETSSSTDIILQSPLYVLNGIWSTAPPAEDVIGGISAIIWALTLLPLLKYVSVLASDILHLGLTICCSPGHFCPSIWHNRG